MRVEPDGTETSGCTSTVRLVCRCSPAALVAESLTVYSPGLVRSGAASRIWSPARFGPATNLPPAAAVPPVTISTCRLLALFRKSSVSGGATIWTGSPALTT